MAVAHARTQSVELEPEADQLGDALEGEVTFQDVVVALKPSFGSSDAEREIDKAVRGRRGIARKYVKWVRRRNPDATPAEIISMLEHHYVTAISVAGAAITVGSIAGQIGIAMIPVAGPAAAGTKAAAKEAGLASTAHIAGGIDAWKKAGGPVMIDG